MDFKIRKTIIEDLKQLPDLYKSPFGAETNIPKMYEKFEELKDDPDYINYSVVTDQNELIGFAGVVIHHDIFEECKDYATIWSVRSKYKRQGIATKLFQFVENEMREKGIDFIALLAVDTVEANEFYKSLDYKQVNGYFKKM